MGLFCVAIHLLISSHRMSILIEFTSQHEIDDNISIQLRSPRIYIFSWLSKTTDVLKAGEATKHGLSGVLFSHHI